ncbi:MAG: hypothetical protein AAB724_02055 [Patescibacteria group bacterium]
MVGNRGQYQSRPSPIVVAVESAEPEKRDGCWNILATAIVTQGARALAGQNIQFFLGSLTYGAPAQTDVNGRVSLEISGINLDAKRISIEAQIVGQSVRTPKIVALPAKKETDKQKPAKLSVDPRRIGNQINFFVIVSDAELKGVGKAKLTIIDGASVRTEYADEDGEFNFSIKLEQNEEREIGIYATGFGDRGFRRTFRGRKE